MKDDLTGKPKEWVNDWARYRAQDKNGRWFEYENRPVHDDVEWYTGGLRGKHNFTSKDQVLGDWRDTLDERMTGDNQIKTTPEAENEIVKAIEQTEWNGDGLPPVGTVCEAASGEEWFRVEVLDYDEQTKLFYLLFCEKEWPAGDVQIHKTVQFRPLKTERERVIVAMADYLCSGTMSHADEEHVHEIVEDLYDNFNITLKDK